MPVKAKKNIKSIVFLGDPGFPVGLAHVQRITLLGRALLEVGCDVLVLCRLWAWRGNIKTHYGKEGIHEGIKYHYTVDSPFRPKHLHTRIYQRLKGLVREFFYLRKLKKEKRIDAAILSTMNFNDALRYKLYSTIFNFPIAVNLVEMASALERRSSLLLRIQNWLMENWLLKTFEGALPISDKLVEFYGQIAPKKPKMKIPVICDYDKFETIERKSVEPYLLYCASSSFMDVAEFVMQSYESMKNKNEINLCLLIGFRKQSEFEEFKKLIEERFPSKNVKLFSNVSYTLLMQLFTDAKALLIPLRHSVEDTARFPHKIGEYLATGNPVITTGVGEINTYFKDASTALISRKYDVGEYAKKMDYVMENKNKAKKIGVLGKELGKSNFHFRPYGTRIKEFMQDL